MSEEGITETKSGPPRAGEMGNWECRKCHNVNFAHRQVCNRCGEPGGNWNCPGCGNLNYSHRAKCNRCDVIRPGMMGGGFGMGGGMGGGYGMGGGMGGGPDDYARDFVQCFLHDPNPVQAAISYLSLNAHNPTLFQPRVDVNAYGGNKRPRGAPGPPQAGVDGNWLCKDCQNVNLAFRVECNRCKKTRGEVEEQV